MSGEGETLDVDVAAWDACSGEVPLDRIRHRRRTAEEDVAIRRVGRELAEVRGGEQPLVNVPNSTQKPGSGDLRARENLALPEASQVTLIAPRRVRPSPSLLDEKSSI